MSRPRSILFIFILLLLSTALFLPPSTQAQFLSRQPTTEGWTPLKVPCSDTIPNAAPRPTGEFSPLRPYPGSPCDPQIPARFEWGNNGNQTFSCANSINATGNYTYSQTYDCSEYLSMPVAPPSNPQIGIAYRCTNDNDCGAPNNVCIYEQPTFDVTMNLSNASLPILGNTQDPLDDGTKANNYLTWYLSGTNPTWLDDIETTGGSISDPATLQCIGQGLAKYVNTVVAGAGNLPHVKLLSPVFNMTSPFEPTIFDVMVASGANFAGLDGFAGNTYTINGTAAYDYYTSQWQGRFMRAASGLPVTFTEYGDFRSPRTPQIISDMTTQFVSAANPQIPNIQGVLYFNAFNGNPEFSFHALTDQQLRTITASNPSKGGVSSGRIIDSTGAFGQRVGSVGLHWGLEIITGGSPGPVADTAAAYPAGVTPIIRLCYGDSCGFSNPQDLVNFLRELETLLAANGRTVWVVAGPNEPATETWATPQCVAAASGFVDPFLTFAGPIRKLLSQDTQNLMRLSMSTNGGLGQAPVGFHDYAISLSNDRVSGGAGNPPPFYDPTNTWSTLFPRIPLNTLEDTVGEVSLSVVTSPNSSANCTDYALDGSCNQPKGTYLLNPGSITDPLAMKMVILPGSDSRIYLPHLKSSTALAQILAGIYRPHGDQGVLRPTASGIQLQPITDHMGMNQIDIPSNVGTGRIVGPDRTVPVEVKTGEGGWAGSDLATRNTEVIEGYPAPSPLPDGNRPDYNIRCDWGGAAWNPSDNLMGSTVTARFGYTQQLTFTPQLVGSGPTCVSEGGVCVSGAGQCCHPGLNCRANNPPDGYGICTRTDSEVTVPTEGRVAVFAKVPLIDNIYDVLAGDETSILRRWVPPFRLPGDTPQDNPIIPMTGSDALSNGMSSINYSVSSTAVTGADCTAGAGNSCDSAEIYYSHLGGIYDYFLGGGTGSTDFNLQDAFRPLTLN